MKKTLLAILAAVSVMGAASAVPSVADRKAMCERNPDRYVWVEKNQACVIRKACDENKFNAYCNRLFANTQTTTKEEAYELVNLYLKRKNNGNRCQTIKLRDGESNNVGQDYVQCITSDGYYYEFEFDDVSERVTRTAEVSVLETICMNIYDAQGFASKNQYRDILERDGHMSKIDLKVFNEIDYFCYGLPEGADCNDFKDDAYTVTDKVILIAPTLDGPLPTFGGLHDYIIDTDDSSTEFVLCAIKLELSEGFWF